jgi:PBP1b-binding outer membrane lipoprotein LpoB
MRCLWIGFAALASLLTGCDAAPKTAASASKTTATATELPNLRGPLRLSKAEREGHIKDCRNSGVLRFNTRVINAAVFAAAREQKASACDCIVNQLEDRTNKLQFTMIMAAVKGASANKGLQGEHPHVRSAAMQSGISPADYKSAQSDLPAIIMAAAEYCRGE